MLPHKSPAISPATSSWEQLRVNRICVWKKGRSGTCETTDIVEKVVSPAVSIHPDNPKHMFLRTSKDGVWTTKRRTDKVANWSCRLKKPTSAERAFCRAKFKPREMETLAPSSPVEIMVGTTTDSQNRFQLRPTNSMLMEGRETHSHRGRGSFIF